MVKQENQEIQAVSQQNEKPIIVYCVIRYGSLIGCYANYEDACSMQRICIDKGQICDLVPKPLIKSFKL